MESRLKCGVDRTGLHSLRHTFATNLINGQKQPDGSIKSLSPRQVADLLGHTTSQITELYYVKKDTSRLNGITDAFEIRQNDRPSDPPGRSKFATQKTKKEQKSGKPPAAD